MHTVTFISTIHLEIGRCNADELHRIIEKLKPEVVFLEAIEETYSEYENYLFATYGVYHTKLEISALQKYNATNSFQYVPVCENGLSEAFHRKNKIVCQHREMQRLLDNYNLLAATHGFRFLNSLESIYLQEEMRRLECRILDDNEMVKIIEADIDEYENPMIRNIYSFCRNNPFGSAIFMCGAAHRRSIIEKIEKSTREEKVDLNWAVFES
jgi:hypothetical protein